MVKKFFAYDVALFLFILTLGGIAFFAVFFSLAPEEARHLSSPFGVARLLVVGGLSLFIFILVKGRRKAVRDRHMLGVFLESAGDGIFVVNRDYVIQLWNREAEKITGHKAADVIGLPLRNVVSFYRERDRTEDVTFIEEAMLYGEPRSRLEPMYVPRKDGSEVPVGNSAAPMKESHGHVSGCIVIFRDATLERKQNSLRSEFAYASHQLRTPVTKALWSLEAAMEKPTLAKEDLEVVFSALKSIRKLSNEILEASEIDQRIVHSKGVSVNISEAISHSLQNNVDCIKHHMVAANTDGVPAATNVHGDAHLLTRAFDELICNAATYSHENGSLTIDAYQEDGHVIIEVKDDGIGVPDEEQALVFSKFFRGNNIDTTRSPGAGLGLYIAKGYVESMGGKMWFKSSGQGSVFSLRLPVSRKVA